MNLQNLGNRIDNLLLSQRWNFYFIISFLFVFFNIFFHFPTLGSEAMIFAETGTNFLYNAYHLRFQDSIILPDAGYLPLFQRVLAYTLIKVFGVNQYTALSFQIISLSYVAFFSALINLKRFQDLIKDNWIRFALSLLLGFFPDYDIYSFINFIYFSIFFIIFFTARGINPQNRMESVLFGFFGMIIFLSKALLLAIAPFLGIFFLYYLYKRKINSLILVSLFLVGAFLQSVYCFLFILKHPTTPSLLKSYYNIYTMAMHMYAGSIVHLIFPFFENAVTNSLTKYLIFFLPLLIALLLYRKDFKRSLLILFLWGTGYLSFIFFLKFIGDDSFPILSENTFFLPRSLRWNFISDYTIILLFFITISAFKSRVFKLIAVISIFISLNFPGKFYELHDPYFYFTDKNGKWSDYFHLMKNDSYCIPINPEPWYISHHCSKKTSKGNDELLAVSFYTSDLGLNRRYKLKAKKNGLDLPISNLTPESDIQYWILKEKESLVEIELTDEADKQITFPKSFVYYVYQ